MTTLTQPRVDMDALKAQFQECGYAIARGLYSKEEVKELRANFDKMHERGPVAGYFEPLSPAQSGGDPLKEYPRVLQPHRYDKVARNYMLHEGTWNSLEALFGEEPVATQSMFYFKPPGARGQALHQDNFYLLVQPGTCIAAWTAIDDADLENGAMYVVPGSHNTPVVCPDVADEKESFTSQFVPVPKGLKAELVPLKAGDTLFFNGSLIHGSGPNRSKTRFRRAFICHYAAGSTEKISHYYLPLVRKDGADVEIEKNTEGGACGEQWAGAIH